jgi:hypothetical protein
MVCRPVSSDREYGAVAFQGPKSCNGTYITGRRNTRVTRYRPVIGGIGFCSQVSPCNNTSGAPLESWPSNTWEQSQGPE